MQPAAVGMLNLAKRDGIRSIRFLHIVILSIEANCRTFQRYVSHSSDSVYFMRLTSCKSFRFGYIMEVFCVYMYVSIPAANFAVYAMHKQSSFQYKHIHSHINYFRIFFYLLPLLKPLPQFQMK